MQHPDNKQSNWHKQFHPGYHRREYRNYRSGARFRGSSRGWKIYSLLFLLLLLVVYLIELFPPF